MIISHEHPQYITNRGKIGKGRFNGAYYYSVEICRYIIPFVVTDRNWITINVPGIGADHAIVFIHNNLHPQNYNWLSKYKDLVLVCGVPETCAKVAHLGQPIYLPLSVKVSEVEKFKTQKTKDTAYVGRRAKRLNQPFPVKTDFIENLPREQILAKMAMYKKVYTIGRCAIEAKILGCEVLPYDERFPDPGRWKIVDCSQAVEILQAELNMIDGV